MSVKAQKQSFILIGVLAFIIVLLMFTLILTQQKRTPRDMGDMPIKQHSPQVVVIDASKEERLPIYPKNLPQYSSPNRPLDYQQIGILTSNETDKEPIVLPLYGRKLYNRSDRWQYYTATDKNNMMRIPLSFGNRPCEDDVGCNEISNGDTLTINIYSGRTFTATVYRTDTPHYFADVY
uniref:Uncharacterized protein n=1 Tax=viral metagenome TaxID=1070528 RepID=A0A6C0CUB7_9ZZZZ